MLEVRFSEVKRSALKDLGIGMFVRGGGNNGFGAGFGNGASLSPGDGTSGVGSFGNGVIGLDAVADSFGVLTRRFGIFGLDISAALNALERKGAITTLAEPTLVALSGETADFLAGGEFPIPVSNGGSSGDGGNVAITVEFKSFGVSLAFTPTVLADGVINLVVAPEVSSIDASASVTVNGLRIPGLQTRRAKTTVELRDGESFALAGLLRKDFSDTVRQFPILGSIPIIGTLFRSTNFQRDETELVIIVTPRLVRPVRAGTLKVPTDRATPPDEADLFLIGRTDAGVGANPLAPTQSSPVMRPIGEPAPAAPSGGMAAFDPSKLEKDYGHAL
jgi:pilus assembly protein CpaC